MKTKKDNIINFATQLYLHSTKCDNLVDVKNLALFNAKYNKIACTFNSITITVENYAIRVSIPGIEIDNLDYNELELIFKLAESMKNIIDSEEE